MKGSLTSIFANSLIRKKPLERTAITQTKLDRCLTTLDLTTLGIGSTLGLGVYILAGEVAANKAGPSVTLSFFIAAIASVFAGLCYAEFGARVPKAGSAYVYSYITVGEFMAFIIGWNLILEYAIGSASIARGYSGYVDSLLNEWMKNHFTEWFPLDFGISPYFDVFASIIAVLLSVLLAIGVKKSTQLNTVFTWINLFGVVYAIICGSFKINLNNWKLKPDEIPEGKGKGGFFAYGFSGMMAGAATCFYGFIGFDMIATTGEEVKNPAKSIPLSIIFSLSVIMISYCGVSAVQTLMVPYYEQNQLAPLPYVFDRVGYSFAKWILTIGAMAGLYSSLLGTMYPLTRVLYSMGNDGMIFRFFSKVHPKLKTPLIATLFSGVFSGLMAGFFDFQQLADMQSIGTLLAYTLVAISVLILRFQKRKYTNEIRDTQIETELTDDDVKLLLEPKTNFWKQIFNSENITKVTSHTYFVSQILVFLLCLFIMILCFQIKFLEDLLFQLDIKVLISVTITLTLIGVLMYALKCQPQTDEQMSFKVPGVPLVPLLSVFVNIYLMLNLSSLTWIRFGVWMILGFLMYFLYAIIESNGYLNDEEKEQMSKSNSYIPNDNKSDVIESGVIIESTCDQKEQITTEKLDELCHVKDENDDYEAQKSDKS